MQTEQPEVTDDLAQETQRTALLDRVEHQLRGQQHVSRLLFAFSLADDRKAQAAVEQEFAEWHEKQGSRLTGLMLFVAQAGVHFLEGPTELLFSALAFFNSLATASEAKSAMKAAAAGGATAGTAATTEKPQPRVSVLVTAQRGPLISSVRVLHFTELHGVRTSTSWCSYVHTGKTQAGAVQVQMDEGNSSELIFATYKKFLLLCLKVSEISGEDVELEKLQANYKRFTEMMPSADEVALFLSKTSVDHVFSFEEFEKVFVAPFHLTLHSELLWPMPPALAY